MPRLQPAFSAYEYFEKDKLQAIVEHHGHLLVSKSSNKLKAAPQLYEMYLKAGKAVPGSNLSKVLIKYFHTSGSGGRGRLYGKIVKGNKQYSVSQQSMSRVVRHSIAGDLYHDLDFKNCHVELLRQLCTSKAVVPCPSLEEICADRDAVFNRIGGQNSKQEIIKCLFGGGQSTHPFLSTLKEEMLAIHLWLWEDPAYKDFQRLTKTLKPDSTNKIGSNCSYILQDIENTCLTALREFLEGEGHEIGALVFDGIQVRRDGGRPITQELLDRASRKVEQKTGYKLTLVEKPMSEGVNIDVSLDPYKKKKRAFEENVCMIDKNLIYIVNGNQYKREGLKELYQDVFLPGDKETFVVHWLRDPDKRKYDSMNFHPGKCPANVYNLWPGYAVEDVEGDNGTIQPFLDLAEDLTGGDSKYFLDWIALLFQHPDVKPRTAVIHVSSQGCGKDTFWWFIGEMMGNQLYYPTADAENDVFGRFSSAMEARKIVLLNEASFQTNAKYEKKLLGLITDPTVVIERKGIQSYVVNTYAGIVMCSNSRICFKQPEDDRRTVQYEATGKYCRNKEFFDSFRKWAVEPANQRAVHNFLLDRDVDSVDWDADRPRTDLYIQNRMLCLPLSIKWIEDLIVRNFPTSWVNSTVTTDALITRYNRFLPHSIERPKNNQFVDMIGKLDGFLWDNSNKDKPPAPYAGQPLTKFKKGTMLWKFDRAKAFEWLKSKQYTIESDLEDPRQEDILY